jgi:DNA-3-methyladenine glycosylase I
MLDPGIRNRRSSSMPPGNAQAWLALEDPVGFSLVVCRRRAIINHFKDRSEVPAITPKPGHEQGPEKAGFTFVGPTICYALMQASGMVMDHTRT